MASKTATKDNASENVGSLHADLLFRYPEGGWWWEIRKHRDMPAASGESHSDLLASMGQQQYEEAKPGDSRVESFGSEELSLDVLMRLPSEVLKGIVKDRSRSSYVRSCALEFLVRRNESYTPTFVAQELLQSDLRPSWRNSLLLAAEHLQFTDEGQRAPVRARLLDLATRMRSEEHVRSRIAQEAALRRYVSLLGCRTDVKELIAFLSIEYPVRLRQVVLQGIQRLFASSPPSPKEVEQLTVLATEIRDIAWFHLRRVCIAEFGAEATLGLNAVMALCKLNDASLPDYVSYLSGLREEWLTRKLESYITGTMQTWSARVAPDCAELKALTESLQRLGQYPHPDQ